MSRYALLSLNDPDGSERLARAALARGYTLLASTETVRHLAKFKLPVMNLTEFTGLSQDYGFPPSLHPRIELALTGDAEERIDLVHVLPYPRAQGLDIGGRTLLALALKGGRLCVCNCQDRDDLALALEAQPEPPEALTRRLAANTAYELALFYARLAQEHDGLAASVWRRTYGLAEGENPYQVPAALYCSPDEDPLGLPAFRQISGQPPCFTNLADADALLHTLTLVHHGLLAQRGQAPFICVAAKHGTACGLGIDSQDPVLAARRALWGSPVAVWGGELALNVPVDAALAQALFADAERERLHGNAHWMLDIVLAPAFTEEAAALLGQRAGRKLLANPHLAAPRLPAAPAVRPVRGGALIQPPADYVLRLAEAEAAGSAPTESEAADCILAWAAAWSGVSGGNEIALARDGQLLSVGGGPSTVEAAHTALDRAKRAGHEVKGAVFAADAFFPFTDAPALLVAAGCARGLVPSGGRREAEVRGFFAQGNVAMHYLSAERRGFCRH